MSNSDYTAVYSKGRYVITTEYIVSYYTIEKSASVLHDIDKKYREYLDILSLLLFRIII